MAIIDEVWGDKPDVADEVYGTSPSAADEVYGDVADEVYADETPRLRLPTPPEPAENFREVAGQIGDVGTLVGKMAIPAVAGGIAGAIVPPLAPGIAGTLATGAVGGVLGGLVTTAGSNAIEGRPITEGMSLLNSGRDAALGAVGNVAMPYAMRGLAAAGRGVGNATQALRARLPLRAPAVSTLPGFDDAITLRAPLPDPDPMPDLMHDQPDLRVARDDLDMSALQGIRTKVSSPQFVLSRSQNSQAAQIAGRRLQQMGQIARGEREAAHVVRARSGVLNLDENERRAVTVALEGHFDDLPQQYQTPRVAEVADRLRRDFYDAASEKMLGSRVVTVQTRGDNRGEVVPYHPLPDYAPWIPREDGVRGTARIRQLLATRGRVPQTTFQRGEANRAPWQQALDELNGIDGPSPTNWETDAAEVSRLYVEGGRGRIGYPELVARSHTFGPIQQQHPDAEHPWGEDANILYQQMLENRAPFEAEMFRKTMEPIYRPNRSDPGNRVLTAIKDRVSHTVLGHTALTQLPQGATPMWRFGLRNDLRGKYDYAVDDSYRELVRTSGARDAGFAREMGDVGAVHRQATEAVEHGLRGFGNAGLRPYLEEIAARVAANNGNVNAATRKQLAELGLTVQDVANGVDANTLRRAFEASAHRNQFHPYDPGESGEFFTSPEGKLLFQFQPFGHAALRNVQEDVFEPLLGPQGWREAYRSGDYSLQRLGAGRAGRLALTGVPAAIATETAKAVAGGRDFKPENVSDTFLGSNFGTPGSLLSASINGYNPATQATSSPLFSLLASQYRNVQTGHPERLLIDAAAAADPTGWAAVLRPTLTNQTRDER